jgi:hypothetical protein
MDGLLDRLFPANPVLGLLGDESMQQQARQQGLLGLAAGLLQAGGPSRTRTNIGQALGSGLMAGQQMYQNAVNQQISQAGAVQKLQEAQRLRQQQELVRQVMPQLVTTERQQALTTGAQAADPLAALIQSAEGGTLNQPAINQQALSQLSSYLPPADFEKVVNALEKRIKIMQPQDVFEYKSSGSDIVQIDKRTGATRAVYNREDIPKLSELGSLYASVQFPGVKTQNLSPQQLGQVLEFQQRPSPAALADLQIKAEALKAETGIDLTRNIVALAGGQPLQAAAAAPAAQPQAPVAAQPEVAQPVTGAQPQQEGFVPTVRNQSVPLKFRTELEVAQPKVVSAARSAIKDLRDLKDAVEQVRSHPGLASATGFGGTALSAIPGTQAANARALLDNLKNRNFIAGIVNLRQQSPTGSGVGSLTEREGARFENLKAALDQAQTVDQLREQLDILSRATNEAISGLYEGYQLDYGKNKTIEEDLKKSVISPAGAKRKSLTDIFGK